MDFAKNPEILAKNDFSGFNHEPLGTIRPTIGPIYPKDLFTQHNGPKKGIFGEGSPGFSMSVSECL